jgi:Flp pilus assembly protein TadB
MTTTVQLWVLAGAMVGGGIALLVWWLQPAQPDLATALARLAPGRTPVSVDDSTGGPAGFRDRVGMWAIGHLPGTLLRGVPDKDLQLLGMPLRAYYGEKVAAVLLVLAGVPVVGGLYSMRLGLPFAVPALATLVAAAVAWLLPDRRIARTAARARTEFRRALGAYTDLIALGRAAGGIGTRQAMETSAGLGRSWPFKRISAVVVRSRYSGVPPWDALADLAAQQGLPDLDDLADTLRLAGEEGAQVVPTLRARSTALRNAITTAERADINAKSDSLMLPTLVMAAAFIGVVIMAAVFRLLAG